MCVGLHNNDKFKALSLGLSLSLGSSVSTKLKFKIKFTGKLTIFYMGKSKLNFKFN